MTDNDKLMVGRIEPTREKFHLKGGDFISDNTQVSPMISRNGFQEATIPRYHNQPRACPGEGSEGHTGTPSGWSVGGPGSGSPRGTDDS